VTELKQKAFPLLLLAHEQKYLVSRQQQKSMSNMIFQKLNCFKRHKLQNIPTIMHALHTKSENCILFCQHAKWKQ